MKKIACFQIVKPNGNITIDTYNIDYQNMDMKDFLDLYLPYTKVFAHITLKNFRTIPADLLSRLTNQYLHGAEIQFITPKNHFDKTYHINNVHPMYSYFFKDLDLTAPVPKSLAEFKFNYKGSETTYLNALKSLTSSRFLPTEIWDAIDAYSKQQINKCREYNKGDYSYAERWFKTLMKDCIANNIQMFSPNKKTYYETMAEIKFEKDCEDYRLRKGLRPLTDQELYFLQKYAPAYGVEIPTFKYRTNSRKTPDGYTEEPEVCSAGMSTSDWSRVVFDARNRERGELLPAFVRRGLSVKELTNDKCIRDAYYQLRWIMKHMGDEGLMPGWKRCPKCHKLYRESEGCECGAIPPIELINANNLFYSDMASYEDYESTHEAYDELDNIEFEVEEDLE